MEKGEIVRSLFFCQLCKNTIINQKSMEHSKSCPAVQHEVNEPTRIFFYYGQKQQQKVNNQQPIFNHSQKSPAKINHEQIEQLPLVSEDDDDIEIISEIGPNSEKPNITQDDCITIDDDDEPLDQDEKEDYANVMDFYEDDYPFDPTQDNSPVKESQIVQNDDIQKQVDGQGQDSTNCTSNLFERNRLEEMKSRVTKMKQIILEKPQDPQTIMDKPRIIRNGWRSQIQNQTAGRRNVTPKFPNVVNIPTLNPQTQSQFYPMSMSRSEFIQKILQNTQSRIVPHGQVLKVNIPSSSLQGSNGFRKVNLIVRQRAEALKPQKVTVFKSNMKPVTVIGLKGQQQEDFSRSGRKRIKSTKYLDFYDS